MLAAVFSSKISSMRVLQHLRGGGGRTTTSSTYLPSLQQQWRVRRRLHNQSFTTTTTTTTTSSSSSSSSYRNKNNNMNYSKLRRGYYNHRSSSSSSSSSPTTTTSTTTIKRGESTTTTTPASSTNNKMSTTSSSSSSSPRGGGEPVSSNNPSLTQKPKQPEQQQGMVNIEELYESASKIQYRHGSGDGVIELNVGGKSFLTLRSTIEQNPMLWYHVHVAEQNQEFIKGAVFIDRDSSQFGLILQHLRNQATGLQLTSSKIKNKLWGSTSKASVSIQIPTDRASRQDLFMEARYFQIYEIQDVLCTYDIYTRLASFVGGGSANPFTAASELMKTLRRMLLATGGTGMVVGGVMNEDLMKDITKVWDDVKGLLSISSGSSSSNSSGGEKQSNPKQELPSSPSPSPSPSPSSAEPSLA